MLAAATLTPRSVVPVRGTGAARSVALLSPPRRSCPRPRAARTVTASLLADDQLPVPRAELPKWLAVAALGVSALAQRTGYG